jgi:hypothetical protein
MLVKILNRIFLLVFMLCAAVQYNDPDLLYWLLVYLAAAILCVRQLFKPVPVAYSAALLLISLAWIALLLPGVMQAASWSEIFDSISMKTRQVEEAREIGGLLLIAVWSSVLLGLGLRSGTKQKVTRRGRP